MVGNKQLCLEVIDVEHMLTETFPCAGPWYRKEALRKATSGTFYLFTQSNKSKNYLSVKHSPLSASASDVKQIY